MTIDVSVAISRVLETFRRVHGDSIDLRTTYQAALPSVRMDRALLEAAIHELTLNAADTMPDKGSLHVQASSMTLGGRQAVVRGLDPGGYVVISILDSGHGKLGGRMVQRLTTVTQLVQGEGGQIKIDAVASEGTKVTLLLPQEACWP